MAEQNNQAERAEFEAWHRSKFATKHSTGQPTRDMHNGIYDENYGPEHQQQMWEAWQAASRAALPAAVDAEGLPPLPTYYYDIDGALRLKGKEFEYGSAGEYVRLQDAQAAIAADRRRQAALTQMIELGREIEAPFDPMDWPVPCDVKVGGVNIRQGCKLRTLVARMESLHRMAVAALPKVTPEQRAEFEALFAAPSHQSPGQDGATDGN